MSAVGTTLHAWSQVESGISQLFWHVSGTSLHKAEAIFDTVVSFETRIAVLDAVVACEDTLSEDEKEVWTSLSVRLRKLYKKRHEVAHFGVASPEDFVSGTRIAPFFTWGKERQKANKYLTHDQIMVRANLFTAAARAVGWFGQLMMRKKLPLLPDAPPLQEPELIVRIRELLVLKKEGQTPQPELGLE
jgi:hypothetical protein